LIDLQCFHGQLLGQGKKLVIVGLSNAKHESVRSPEQQ
jgi:hypothetical protein